MDGWIDRLIDTYVQMYMSTKTNRCYYINTNRDEKGFEGYYLNFDTCRRLHTEYQLFIKF